MVLTLNQMSPTWIFFPTQTWKKKTLLLAGFGNLDLGLGKAGGFGWEETAFLFWQKYFWNNPKCSMYGIFTYIYPPETTQI